MSYKIFGYPYDYADYLSEDEVGKNRKQASCYRVFIFSIWVNIFSFHSKKLDET
jgi:hypothetical protein